MRRHWRRPRTALGGAARRRRPAELAEYDYYLNAGGDLVVGLGAPDAPAWRIGIEDPRAPGGILAVREVSAGGVATSGTAARGAHIVNPHTGRAAGDPLSVTVLGPTLLWADVYATAAFAMGSAALSWLADHAAGYSALVVGMDGRPTGTP